MFSTATRARGGCTSGGASSRRRGGTERPCESRGSGPSRRSQMTFGGKVTWLGHSMFLIESRGGKRLVVDPFVEGNPKFPKGFDLARADVIAATHGHHDHFGDDGIALARTTGATVCCIYELALWCGAQGL